MFHLEEMTRRPEWGIPIPRRRQAAQCHSARECRRLCMDSRGHTGRRPIHHNAQAVNIQRCQTCCSEKKKVRGRDKGNRPRRDRKVAAGKIYSRSVIHHLDGKCHISQEVEW